MGRKRLPIKNAASARGGRKRMGMLTRAQRAALGRKGARALWAKIRAAMPAAKRRRARPLTQAEKGRRGGAARARALSPARRRKIARRAALARHRRHSTVAGAA